MTPQGNINYTISIDKIKDYTRIYDIAVDEDGNLYAHTMKIAYNENAKIKDAIVTYNKKGELVKTILEMPYEKEDPNRMYTFPQFGSLHCENSILTFSYVQKKEAVLYRYDTKRKELTKSAFAGYGYAIIQLMVKDFQNFIYTTLDGDMYAVKNGGQPVKQASFDFSPGKGGVIPWYLNYDDKGDILFFDVVSGIIYRLNGDDNDGAMKEAAPALPESFFNVLREQGETPKLKNFGFFNERFAGAFGETVWYYDGAVFHTYENGVTLPVWRRAFIAAIQLSFLFGIIFFFLGIYVLFVHIFDRYVSLFIKQTIVIAPIVIIALIALYLIVFNAMSKRLHGEILSELKSTAMLSANFINGDEVESLKSIKDYTSAAYERLEASLKRIGATIDADWNKVYYTAIYIGKHFEYSALFSTGEPCLLQLAEYLDETSEEYHQFMSGKPVAFFYTLSTGTWYCAQAPIYNGKGQITGMLEIGIDMIAQQINDIQQQKQVALFVLVTCLVILAALTIVLSIVVKQLASVADILSNIASGNYKARVNYQARDELGKVSSGLNFMAQELQNQFDRIHRINESTIRFVPFQFMEHLGVSEITSMKLGDNIQCNLTVLFFDIRSFSINSEMMNAKENFMFINKVLGIAGSIFHEHNGFVDKYLGDAAMVLFDNAIDALRAGVKLYQKLVLDEQTKVRIGVDGINIGVGIHSGSVMMGIVGETQRLSTTVISKNVNMASRMESLTKQTKSGMLVTHDTMNQIAGYEEEFNYRFIGMTQASGVNEVVGVFDMLDALPAGVRKRRMATKLVFESGVRKFHTKEYKTAYARFEQVVNADPTDACAANALAETKKRLENPTLPSIFMFEKK
jgi:class 3 adenylate cyclase/HAMP domain-containing protein